MRRRRRGSDAMRGLILVVFLWSPASLLAQSTGNAPRELTEQDIQRLRASVAKSKDRAAIAAAEAERQRQEDELKRKQEELRRQEESLAYDDGDYYEESEPEPVVDTASAIFNGFMKGAGDALARQREADAKQQRFLSNLQREAEAVDRQRQRELERQRLAEERARLERQAEQQRQLAAAQQRQASASGSGAGANGASGSAAAAAGGTATNALTAQQQAAKAREETLRANVAAERKRMAEERERTAAAERQRVAGKPQVPATTTGVAPATPAAVSPTPKPVAEVRDYGPAKAWCRARRNEMAKKTEYQCMGPLQNLLSWYPTLDAPLGMAGCPGGDGYAPTPEHGGSSFNCGRKLKVGDLRMPTYDPYRGGGNPARVTAGD